MISGSDGLDRITCGNSLCQAYYSFARVLDLSREQGLIYAECEDDLYVGITCEKCNWPLLIRLPRHQRMIDLQGYIMMPDPLWEYEIAQQIIWNESESSKNDFLEFKYLPAWNGELVSCEVIKKTFGFYKHRIDHGIFEPLYSMDQLQYKGPDDPPDEPIPSSMISTDEIRTRAREETMTGRIRLRRLFPNTQRFIYLISCISHPKITGVRECKGFLDNPMQVADKPDAMYFPTDEGEEYLLLYNSERDIDERNSSWLALLESVAGAPLKEASKHLLRDRRIKDFDEFRFDKILSSILYELHGDETVKLRHLTERIGFDKGIWNHLRNLSQRVLQKTCTELSLDAARKSLNKWVDWVDRREGGKALLVDAPMGLGKTYSITDALAQRQDLSAVIFMPTLRMCEEVTEQLKTKIAKNRGTYRRDRMVGENIEEVEDENGDVVIGKDGFPIEKWKREFLEDQVYFVDGINKNECLHFEEINSSYRQRKTWKKKNYCRTCENLHNKSCRFLKHNDLAKSARIVVTTHAQYDKFFNNIELHRWHKAEGEQGSGARQAKTRDLFIVDEDMVLANCYQPATVEHRVLEAFVKDFCDFLSDFDGTSEIIEKIETFYGRVTRCEENTIIPPIQRRFSIPEEITNRWKEELIVEYDLQHSEYDELIGLPDLSDLLAHAIRVGASVERFDQYNAPYGERFRIHFANPRHYDLCKVPAHVFFDGTMLEERFLRKKLKKIAFEKMRVEVKPLWKLKVHQNICSDLPKKTIYYDKPFVERLVMDLIHTLEGRKNIAHKYFFLTNKHTRETYLESFMKREFPQINSVLCHYRYMKGINDAKDCDVGVMLGSYVLPISAEVAMALEFTQRQLVKKGKNISLDETFSWKGGNARRVFKEDWAVTGRLGDSLRLSEHRQGIARTRYIFHDVELYALSKDPIKEYEDLAEIETDQFRMDLFSRQERSDSQYPRFKEDIEKWLSKHEHATVTDMKKVTGLGRRIVRKHLYKMVDDKLLRKTKHGREFWYTKMDTIS